MNSDTSVFSPSLSTFTATQNLVLEYCAAETPLWSDIITKTMSILVRNLITWPAAGSKDTELGVWMEPEVNHETTELGILFMGPEPRTVSRFFQSLNRSKSFGLVAFA